MEDTCIIELFFQRDEAALREIASKYGGKLSAIARSITENDQDAEECVNDTYLEAWQAIPPARPTHLFAYLAKIIRNNALSLCEKQHAKKRSGITVELTQELYDSLPSALDLACEEESARIRAVLNRFLMIQKPDARRLFVRRYFYTLSVAQLAAESGLTESAVTARLYRLREALRKQLEKEGFEL